MRLLALAARNLLRNKRRTVITLAAISVGLTWMLYAATLVNGISKSAFDKAISSQAGHVVVQAEGWQDQRKATQWVDGVGAIEAVLETACPDAVIAPRLFLGGLLTSPSSSARVGLTALVPEAERRIQELHEKVVDGEWLGEDAREIVIGRDMAEMLGVGLGDKLVFSGQFGSEEVATRLFRVRGIVRTGAAAIDARAAWIHLEAGQALLGGGDVAHVVTLHLADPDASEQTAAAVRAALGRPELDVRTWREALPDLVGLLKFTSASTDALVAVLGFIAAFGILNTLLMSALERTREFGVMRALGLRPRQVRRLVLLEGLVLGVFGALVGLLLGVPACWYLVRNGMDYGAMGMGETMETGGVVIDSLIHGAWDPVRMVAYSIAAVLVCVAAAVYPAWSISRLRPVQALRHR